jgi:LemA protein
LKASGLIEKAMIEMSTSQNKISQEMRKNQLAVETYNVTVKRFPTVIIASMTGNTPKPFFAANETEQNAPELFKKK